MKYFVGREAEGSKDKNVLTLFVGHEYSEEEVSVRKIVNWLIQNKINRVYFGASNYRKLPLWINDFIDNCPSHISLIAEIKDIDEVLKINKIHRKRIEFVLFLDTSIIHSIKTIIGDTLTWIDLETNHLSINKVDDPIYSDDKEILL